MNDPTCRLTRQPTDHGRRPASTLPPEAREPAEPVESVCGWYESSWDLRQGLAVSELPDSDLPLAALWFAGFGDRCRVSSVARP